MFCDLKFLFYLCKIKQNTAFCLKKYLFYMKDRIKQLMESQHMSQQTFADFIGISSPTLSSIFNGRTKPSIYTVEAIRSKFPTISLDWLMYGNGPMFKDDISSPSPDQTPTQEGRLDFNSEAPGLPPTTSGTENRGIPSNPVQKAPRVEVKYLDKPKREITEIRIFFNDQTWETFVPKK